MLTAATRLGALVLGGVLLVELLATWSQRARRRDLRRWAEAHRVLGHKPR
jgi:hypothetical protein